MWCPTYSVCYNIDRVGVITLIQIMEVMLSDRVVVLSLHGVFHVKYSGYEFRTIVDVMGQMELL